MASSFGNDVAVGVPGAELAFSENVIVGLDGCIETMFKCWQCKYQPYEVEASNYGSNFC